MTEDHSFSQEEFERRRANELIGARLEGIESELKGMRGMMERLVRVEERLTTYLEQDRQLDAQITEVFKRLNTLEKETSSANTSMAWIERFFWVAVAAVATWLGSGKS